MSNASRNLRANVRELQALRLQPGEVLILKAAGSMEQGDVLALAQAVDAVAKHLGIRVAFLGNRCEVVGIATPGGDQNSEEPASGTASVPTFARAQDGIGPQDGGG